jgi:hypothetical protein
MLMKMADGNKDNKVDEKEFTQFFEYVLQMLFNKVRRYYLCD